MIEPDASGCLQSRPGDDVRRAEHGNTRGGVGAHVGIVLRGRGRRVRRPVRVPRRGAGVVVDARTTEPTSRRSAAARPRTGAPHEQEVADLRRDHRRRPRDGAACKCRPREAANECATLLRAVRPSAASSAASCCSSRQARSAFAWLRSRATLGLVSSQLSACNEPGASRTSRMRAVDATDTQHCRSKCICHHVDHARTRSIYAASKRAQGIEYWRACHGVSERRGRAGRVS